MKDSLHLTPMDNLPTGAEDMSFGTPTTELPHNPLTFVSAPSTPQLVVDSPTLPSTPTLPIEALEALSNQSSPDDSGSIADFHDDSFVDAQSELATIEYALRSPVTSPASEEATLIWPIGQPSLVTLNSAAETRKGLPTDSIPASASDLASLRLPQNFTLVLPSDMGKLEKLSEDEQPLEEEMSVSI